MSGGALLRLARVYRRRGAYEQALHAYGELTELDRCVEEWPSGLLARLGRISVFEETGRTAALRDEAARLTEDLAAGRWSLTKTQYESYSLAARAADESAPDDAAAKTRAEAAIWLWEHRTSRIR